MSDVVRVASIERMQLPALSAAMLVELDAVLDGALFHQAADLSGMLSYLVDCTLSGAHDRLTDYSIAVDSFGGIEAFETHYSGPPQRHIDRLRMALYSHYVHCDPVKSMCLTLIPGSYRVWLVRPEVAYPQLYSRSKMVEWPRVPSARRIVPDSVWCYPMADRKGRIL